MPDQNDIVQTNTFTNGLSSDIAADLMPNSVYRYMLNCNVLSSADGNMGIVTNVKGNIEIFTPLPVGTNRTIGYGVDEESHNFYFFVWNSLGLHTWYRFNDIDRTVSVIIQSVTDTGGIEIWNIPEGILVLHVNVIQNNLLYWSQEGQTPRKVNINKCLDKSATGYGVVIQEVFTRAYKRTSVYSPPATYFTDDTKKFNRLYGNQFKFSQRFVYDDGEYSNWSDWGIVPLPSEEYFTGTKGVPLDNNGIQVQLETGSEIVTQIEIGVQKTNPDGGVLPWQSIITLDKKELNITSNSTYTYNFFNDRPLRPINPEKIIRPYSFLPAAPKCQEFTKNALLYFNFDEGWPVVEPITTSSVRYEDLFIDPGTVNEFNDPSFLFQYQSGGVTGDTTWIAGRLEIGEDVKKGNKFEFYARVAGRGDYIYYTYTAQATDTALYVAYQFANMFRTNFYFTSNESYVHDPVPDGFGGAYFDVRFRAAHGVKGTWQILTPVNPVQTNSLKDNGQSVQNIKLGSSAGYGIEYEDVDGRKSAVYSNQSMTVAIQTINELGAIKHPVITFNITHKAPDNARYWQLVRTKDLVYRDFIQIVIQKTTQIITSSGDEYTDLVIGSLFTYQQLHPNTTLTYEFKKGDRVRLISNYNPGTTPPSWDIVADVKDFEIIAYNPIVTDPKNENVVVDGTAMVTVSTGTKDNIGSFIRIDGNDREIIDATETTYTLDRPLSTGDPDNTTKTYPSYDIINRRGTIRIKYDPDYPIHADPENEIYPLVEVYTPSIGGDSTNNEQFFEFSYKFEVTNGFHSGNIQNQTSAQASIVDVSSGTSYVRNREFPINNNPLQPNVVVSPIEDPSYSDFYVSNMYDDGRSNALDTGAGIVHFGSRGRFSNNYIEDTRINGLNDFDNTDREDYNDKYGDIERVLFSDGRLYVFKNQKDAWMPILGHIITDQDGSSLLSQSTRLIADTLQYFVWEGGVGDNPESVVRNGNQIYHASPNSGIIARIGGNGVEPISITYNLDKEIRDIITSATRASAKIYGGFDRKNDVYIISIENHKETLYNTPFSDGGWQTQSDPLPASGVSFEIVTDPDYGDGTISGSDLTYTPDEDYIGEDGIEYKAIINGVDQPTKHICLDILPIEGPKAWRPIAPYCIVRYEATRTEDFIRNNCPYGEEGTTISYSKTYNSDISQADADQKMADDYPVFLVEGQDNANMNGMCNIIPPTLIVNNTDTDLEDEFRLFVDVDVQVYVNSVQIANVSGTETQTFDLDSGDEVRILQYSNPLNNPWPPDSTGSLHIEREDGTVLYDESSTVQIEFLHDFTFTAHGGEYTVNSLGISTVTGWRKYNMLTQIDITGVTDIPGLEYHITDTTNSVLAGIKATLDNVSSEFNVVNDAGNCSIEVVNQSPDGYRVTLTNSDNDYNYLVFVDTLNNHTFPDVPKGDYIIIVEEGGPITYPAKWIADPEGAYCEQEIIEDDFFDGLATPFYPALRGDDIVYADASLNKFIFVPPIGLTQADIPGINSGGIDVPQQVPPTPPRLTGWYYHPATDYAYVQGFYTNGLMCMRLSDGALITVFPGGSNGSSTRGNVIHIPDLDEVWAIGNTIFLKVNLTSNSVVTGGIELTGSITNIVNVDGKIYVFRDFEENQADIWDVATSTLIGTIDDLCQSINPDNGGYSMRGFYTDAENHRIYFGEISDSPQVIVIDTASDTVVNRIMIPKEGEGYGSVGVINFNPVRNKLYIGGGIFSDIHMVDSQARLWSLNELEAIDDTIAPSANKNISDIIYFPQNNSVYISSRGANPPVSGHDTDGVLFKFT